MQFRIRIARRRAEGGVDTISGSIEASTVAEAITAAHRAMDTFLARLPGVGVLTDALQGGIVWSHRWNMPSPPEADFLRPLKSADHPTAVLVTLSLRDRLRMP